MGSKADVALDTEPQTEQHHQLVARHCNTDWIISEWCGELALPGHRAELARSHSF